MPQPSHVIGQKFPFEPTPGQRELFSLLDIFLDPQQKGKPTLILNGYAGTGKTTIVSSLVKVLPLFNYKYVLLAPTGRAAKVMATYSERKAYTIHKVIYKSFSD